MSKKGSYFFLNEDTKDRISSIANEKDMSQGEAIEYVFRQYDVLTALLLQYQKEDNILEEIKKIREDLSRIRGTANVIDRHAQMQTEFWNHYFTGHPSKEFVTTEKYQRKELQEAEMLVKKRVAENRQKKVDYEKRKGQKES